MVKLILLFDSRSQIGRYPELVAPRPGTALASSKALVDSVVVVAEMISRDKGWSASSVMVI
jgi:hypothetical protein